MPAGTDVDSEPLTVESLYFNLRAQILSGELPPGSPLSQVKLARALGVGRTPLREALRMLQREGLVDAEFNRRVRVADLSTSELAQIYATRVVVEAMAVRVSIPRLDGHDIEQLDGLLGQMESYMPDPRVNLNEWEQAHSRFHRLLVSRAGPRIVEMTGQLQDQAVRYRNIIGSQAPSLFGPGALDHATLLAAARDRDLARASTVLATHLTRAGLALLSEVSPAFDAVALREALKLVVGPRGSTGVLEV